MPSLDRSSTVAQLVAQHAITARVFQKYGIDFCCHGDVSVPEACRGRALDSGALYAELEAIIPQAAGSPGEADPRALPLGALIAFIVERHHAYLRQALPYLAPLVAKVARVHGAHNAKLPALLEAFAGLRRALEPHIDDEEETLFPALLAPVPDTAVVRRELQRMRDEHLLVGELLARIRALADGFTTPEWGCNTYRVVMSELEVLETDVLRHVHLENHVLMPRFTGEGASR